ncbi:MAG: HAMP domain-containing protein [Magnetococcales bacterium]|nr:HAMP domain-containing protein [Magnetococcales bacterium]
MIPSMIKKHPLFNRLFVRREFKFSIVLIIVGLTIPTAVIIASYSYYLARESSLDIAHRLAIRMSRMVIQKTVAYFEPAQTLTKISATLFKNERLSDAHKKELENYLLQGVHAQKGVDYLYYGKEDGSYINGVWIAPQKEYGFQVIERPVDGPAVKTMRYYDANLNYLREEVTQNPAYDPRKRPWYIGAKQTGAAHWTDTYVFYTTKQLGVTVSEPVYGEDGVLKGVMAADITLSGMSAFLKQNKISNKSMAFIIDEQDQFVAYPDFSKVLTTENGKQRPMKVSAFDHPWIAPAVDIFRKTGADSFQLDSGDEKILGYVVSFPHSFGKKWRIVILIPESDFTGNAKQIQSVMLIISGLIMVLASVIGMIFGRRIARPIERLTAEVEKIQGFDLEGEIDVQSNIHEIDVMGQTIQTMKRSLSSFRRYVPAELVRDLIESGIEVQPGGSEKTLTLFFSDIAGFTTISEQVPAAQLMEELSEYMEEMSRGVRDQDGTIDKYIGDAVMAFWGAPKGNEHHARAGCQAALDCQRAVTVLNNSRVEMGKPAFYTRIGLHTGTTIVGNMGSTERLNYTVIGDSVNLAARLEGVNKVYSTQILVSAETRNRAKDHFLFRPLDTIAVKGKNEGVAIFELLCERDGEQAEYYQTMVASFESVRDHYLNRRWDEALDAIDQFQGEYPEDGPAELYRQRCLAFQTNDPGTDWDGVVRLESK